MLDDDALNETVVFELFDGTRAERLCDQLRPRWHVDLYESEECVLVATELQPREDDLAILLRAVGAWAGDNALPALRFHLDGRAYVLDGGKPLLRATAA